MSIRKIMKCMGRSNNYFLKKIKKIIRKTGFYNKYGVNYLYRAKMDDKEYIIMKYKNRFGVEPNLDNPRNFNEKNNWRKLNDRNPIYTDMVDKYRVKQVISDRCGEGYAFPLLGAWSNPKDIKFDELPDKFVLKTNHAGGVIVCRDKNNFNRRKAIYELKTLLKMDYFVLSREWPYKNVARKVIAEQYMGENLIDYKNYCFNGKLLYTLVWQNHSRKDGSKPEAHFCGAYDRSWGRTDMEINYPTDDIIIDKPKGYEEMIMISEKMSKDIPFVRVDCYIIEDHVYVGEMTFFPWGGFQKFKDEKWNLKLGELEKLPGIDY